MITVFGRSDSSAVARVMWALGELGLAHERLDWGGAFGGNDEASYREMCPSGKIPAIRLETGETLWESNAIIRYLCTTDPEARFLPIEPYGRAHIEAWMDWAGAFQNAVSTLRKTYKADDATEASILAACEHVRPTLAVLDTQLRDRAYVGGARISAADFALGVWAHRLWRCPDIAKPDGLEAIWAWVERLQMRAAYRAHVVEKVSAGPQRIAGGEPSP